MATHRCPRRIRRVPGACRFWTLFALLTLVPSTALHGLAASVYSEIPVKAIGAPPPTAVTVDYLRDDRTVARHLSNAPLSNGLLRITAVPGSSEVRISAEGFEAVEVPVANASLGISLASLSRLAVKWPFKTEAKLPPTLEIHVLPREKRPASTKVASRVPGTDTYAASVPPGHSTLLVSSPGNGVAASAPLELRPGSVVAVTKLEVLPSRDVTVRVTDPEGSPIPASTLRFRCEDSRVASSLVGSWLATKAWRADAEGRIELRSVPSSSCLPELAAKGFRKATLEALPGRDPDPGAPRTAILHSLPRLHLEIESSLLGPEDSADVSLILSEAESGEGAQPEGPPGPKTIWAGRIRQRETLQGLEGGLYRARARAGSRTAGVEFRLSASADAPDEQTVRIRFEPRSVRGRVFIGENPGSRIPVEALPHDRRIKFDAEPIASTTSNEDGSFELPVSYVGSIVLRARLSDKNLIYAAVEPDPDPEKEVVLRGWASSITVRVFDAATGDPVPDGMLELTHFLTNGHKVVSTRPVPGETTLTGLGSGKLRLSFSSPRHHTQEMDLTLLGDEEMPLDFSLTPKSPTILVVTGEGGEPVDACEVLSANPMRLAAQGSTRFENLGQTDWSGRVVLDDLPSNTVLAFLRPGYSLQFSRTPSTLADSGGGSQSIFITLPGLREKLPVEAAQQLAQSLAGPPTFVAEGLLVPSGLGRHLAALSGLDDQLLLSAGPEALLLWSRILPPGEYTIFSRPDRSIPPADGKETEVQTHPNVAMAILY